MSRTFIGFDFGTKRIGVATGQDVTGTAQAIGTVSNSGKEGPWTEIKALIDEWRPDGLVVGIPFTSIDSETELARATRNFAAKLNTRYHLPVDFIDETLTSIAAEQIISSATVPGKRFTKKRETLRDQIAAELILQTYLNHQLNCADANRD